MSAFFFGDIKANRTEDDGWNIVLRDEDGKESVIHLGPGDAPNLDIRWNDQLKTWEYRALEPR